MTSEWLTTPLPGVVEGGVIEVEWAFYKSVERYDADGGVWRSRLDEDEVRDPGTRLTTSRWRWLNRPAETVTIPAETVTIPADEWARVSGAARSWSEVVHALSESRYAREDAPPLVKRICAIPQQGHPGACADYAAGLAADARNEAQAAHLLPEPEDK
jgi:hypothetical protein